MPRLIASLLLLTALPLVGSFAAEPNRTEVLAKAKTKFEQDVSKAEDALIASIDKALAKAQAAGNKAAAEKLTYEREQFVNRRTVPASVPTALYLKQRTQAITALETAYRPALKELAKGKKGDEVEALERTLSGLLKSARGYGLAFPDLSSRPALLIENKATSLVLEAEGREATGDVVLAAKVGKQKLAQYWYLDNDEKGHSILNAQSGRALFNVRRYEETSTYTAVGIIPLDPKKAIPDSSLFQLSEEGRNVVITSTVKGETFGHALTVVEKKRKGVTVYELTMTKTESPPAANQLWVLTEAK